MPRSKLSDARVDYLYYVKGMSTNQIGEVLGYSGVAIYFNLKKRGKKLRPKGRHRMVTINLSGDWRKQLNAELRK
jgi:DNA-binding transcriptional regulator LsrR (DeoR family)|tara:strand:- start:68 stop:292 length:225 start_codon:yes stop_codon:yes gene_type:complete